MKFLGVDTTNKCAKIILACDGNIKTTSLGENEKQSENLMNRIDEFLRENDMKIKDINCFGVVVGPGSFTGIRVGVATIKAFAYALNKPVVCVNIFDVVAGTIPDGVCVLKCTSTSCYYGVIEHGKVKEMGVCEFSELQKFAGLKMFSLEEEHLEELNAYTFNVITNYLDLLPNKFKVLATKGVYAKTIEPLYLQLSQAERNLVKKDD